MGLTTKKAGKPQTDPLYIIFEQHLCNFQDPEIDRKTFIAQVIADYLTYLRKRNITVPKPLEQPIVEELAHQVNKMLVKKIYGCFNMQEYQKELKPTIRKRAKKTYAKLTNG